MNTTITNNPDRRGELAAHKMVFGKNNRYAVAPVHTRFQTVVWFLWDAETPDVLDYDKVLGFAPGIIRQTATYGEAIAGL